MKKLIRSFGYALDGIEELIRSDKNFKIHILALIIVISAAFYFNINSTEWLILLCISALVIAMEIVNSTIERVCDLISLEKDKRIKTIKDVSAGAVLIVSIFAVIIGVMIFWKYIFINQF